MRGSGRTLRFLSPVVFFIGFGAVATLQSLPGGPLADSELIVPADEVAVQLPGTDVALACPPGVVDARGSALPGEQTFASANLGFQGLRGAGSKVVVPASQDASFTAITAGAEKSGDLAGIVAGECVRPMRDQTIPAGATTLGEQSVLILSNPNDKAVTAQVQVLTAAGAALDSAMPVVVPANATKTVLPGSWLRGETRMALRVQADGLGVAAWLQTSGLNGEVPQGVTRVGGQVGAQGQTISGVSPSRLGTLRVVNLGTQATPVSILAITDEWPIELGGVDDVSVEPFSVFDFDLSGVSPYALALQIEANEPIVAAVMETAEGQPFYLDPELRLGLRTLAGAAPALTDCSLPSLGQAQQLAAPLTLASAQAVITNGGHRAVTVDVSGEQVTIDGLSALALPLEASGVRLRSNDDLHVAVVLTTEDGESAVVSLSQDQDPDAEVKVTVRPSTSR